MHILKQIIIKFKPLIIFSSGILISYIVKNNSLYLENIKEKLIELYKTTKILPDIFTTSIEISDLLLRINDLLYNIVYYFKLIFNISDNILNLNIKIIHDYLDTLTVLEEQALLNILLFIILLTTIFGIMSVFFGNELIAYFKLEERYPFLSSYLKLRAKFQRYYLMWNISILTLTCLVGIGMNLLVFYVKFFK